MRLVGLLLIAACDKGQQPTPRPRPIPEPIPVVLDARVEPPDAMPLDALPGTPAIELPATAMAGPFATEDKLCEALVCPPTSDQYGTDLVEIERVCDPPEEPDIGTRMPRPPAPFKEVFLKSMYCHEKLGRDGGQRTYRIAVHRPDGYWISGPMFTVDGNPKYCAGGLTTKWQTHDLDGTGPSEAVLTMKGHTECLGCNKQGIDSDGLDLLIAIADGTTPVSFRPIVVGQHFHQKAEDYVSPDNPCPTLDHDAVLEIGWTGSLLSLTGAATWRQPFPEEDGIGIRMGSFDVQPPVPSTVGKYHFMIP